MERGLSLTRDILRWRVLGEREDEELAKRECGCRVPETAEHHRLVPKWVSLEMKVQMWGKSRGV